MFSFSFTFHFTERCFFALFRSATQVLNLRTDELLISFKQEVAVTSLTFRTDAAAAQLPLLASGGGDGRICLWDLKERRLHHTMGAHEGGISKLQFLPR